METYDSLIHTHKTASCRISAKDVPDLAKVKWQKADQWLLGAELGEGVEYKGHQGTFWVVAMPYIMIRCWLYDRMHLSKQNELYTSKMYEY